MRSRRAVTLAEMLLATALVAVAILAVMAVFVSSMKLMSQSTEVSSATQVGREFLENTKRAGYANVTVGNFDGRGATPTAPNAVTLFPLAPYPKRDRYSLVVNATTYTATVKTVQVDVYFSTNSKISLVTLIHQ